MPKAKSTEDNNTSKSAKITGKCKWASVIKPNTKFDPKWSIDVIIEDKEVANRLEAAGLKVKKDKDGDLILNIKRKTVTKKGDAVKPPIVVDNDGERWDSDILIGNGSIVTVDFTVYEYESFGNTGYGNWLNKVTVNELVEYSSKGKVDMDFSDKSTVDLDF